MRTQEDAHSADFGSVEAPESLQDAQTPGNGRHGRLVAIWYKLVGRIRDNWEIPSRVALESALESAQQEAERAERAYMVSSVAGERLRQAESEIAELRLELAGERGRRAQAETVAEDARTALRGEIEKRLKLEEERERKKKSRPAPAPVRVLSPAIRRNASRAQIDKKRRDASRAQIDKKRRDAS